MKHHYTYLIQHKTEDKKYIGVRSSICHPLEDTGYWGSSKHLPEDIHVEHIKTVLEIWPTRKEAVAHEIRLHNEYDVAVNPLFYNRAKQTSIGFDTSGVSTPKTAQHRLNCSIAQKALAALPNYVNPLKGVSLSDETKLRISVTKRQKCEGVSITNNRYSPWFITDTVANVTHLFFDTTKDEYATERNFNMSSFRSAIRRSKGMYIIKRGEFKGLIIGNVRDAKESIRLPSTRKQVRAWFITYDTYSVPYYYTSKKEYGTANNINPQTISDAINLSKGFKKLKRGQFRGLILGKIT